MKNKNQIMNKQRVIRILLTSAAVLLLCGAFCGAAAADGEMTIPAAGGYLESGTYKLTADVTLTEDNLIVTDGVICTIDLNGFVLKGNGDGPVITIEGISSLTLTDSSPDKEHRFTADASGVWVLDPKGDKVVKGGIITGGAAESGGAVYLGEGASVLTINGGTIVGNQSTSSGGGIYCSSEYSEVTIDGGNLIGNVSGTSGTGAGGALYTKGDAVLKNGIISCNKSGSNGGGIYISTNGSLIMENGTISYNTSGRNGGGVAVFSRELSDGFIMNGGEITNNTISGADYCGAGVSVYDNSLFTMNGGTIKGNTALNGANGGGVGVEYSNGFGVFILNNGTITENSADGIAGAVYVGKNDSTLMVSGSPYVKSNTNLKDGSWDNICAFSPENIVLTGKLEDADIYVNVENAEDEFVFAVVDEDYAASADPAELAADAAQFRFEFGGSPGFVTADGKYLRWGSVYTVSFDMSGSGIPAPADQKIHQGGHASEPAVNGEGRTVAGWYADDKFTTKWNFNKDRVNADLTLYAKWEDAAPASPGFGLFAAIAGLGCAAVVFGLRRK